MATIRSYTTIEQSRKLAEILPVESADMYYPWYIEEDGDTIESGHRISTPKIGDFITHKINKMVLPCWSLASLLGVLPPYLYEWEKGIDFSLYPSVAKKRWWCAGYISQDLSPKNKDKFTLITHADNPIDACYEMVLKLDELNLL